MIIPELLKKWRGYDYVRDVFRMRGYSVHDSYRSWVSGYMNCSPDELERYWREVAIEYVTSGGTTVSNTREFIVTGAYRSEYLDSLARALPKEELVARWLPLFPAIRRLTMESNGNPGLSFKIADEMTRVKASENIRPISLKGGGFDAKKGQFSLLKEMSMQRGFHVDKSSIEKRIGDIRLKLKIDLGGRRYATGIQVEWILFIESTKMNLH